MSGSDFLKGFETNLKQLLASLENENIDKPTPDIAFSFGAQLIAIGKQFTELSGFGALSPSKQPVITIDDKALHTCLMAALREYETAVKKFPTWPDDQVKRAAVVAEEAGELIQAANNYDLDNSLGLFPMHQEATQTVAVGLRMMVALHTDIKKGVQHG